MSKPLMRKATTTKKVKAACDTTCCICGKTIRAWTLHRTKPRNGNMLLIDRMHCECEARQAEITNEIRD